MSDLDQNDPDVLAPVEGENDPSTSAGPRRRKPRKKEPVAAPAPVAAVEAEAPAAPPVAAKPVAAKPAAPVKVIEPVVDAAPADADLAPSEPEEAVEDGDDEPVLAAPPPVRPTSRRDDYRSGRLFSDFPISPELIQGLTDLGYSEATQVQAEAIEPALAGQDLLVRAKTGTGKTAAFGIPLVERCEPGLRKVQVLVLSPTRELANQIATEIAGIAKYRDLRILPIYGGVGMGGQEKALREGVEIVIGTPGRVLDHLRRGNLNLGNVRGVCLDEADEMLSMGFYKEVSSILKHAPAEAQMLMFSATVDEDVKRLVQRHLKDPVDIFLSTDTDRVEGIRHVLYEAPSEGHRVRALLSILDSEQCGATIIFCNTREDCSTVATFLDRQGLEVELLSGELPQKKREQVMAEVKSGRVQFLVSTDVAARGIDISDISHVFNYSLPPDPAVYMHRIGRTGRIGKSGIAISLAGGPDLSTRLVLERQFAIQFEYKTLPTREVSESLRLERQVSRIREAMGSIAFEGFIGMARALKAHPEGDLLLATALKTFFQWDRERRAAKSDVDSIGALAEARSTKAESRRDGGGGRDGGRDGGGRGDRGDRRRDDRPPREERSGDRGDRGGDRGERRRDDRPRDDRPRDDRPPREEAPAAALSDERPVPPTEESAASAEGRKRKRRRKKRGAGEPTLNADGTVNESSVESDGGDDEGDDGVSVQAPEGAEPSGDAPANEGNDNSEGDGPRRRRRRR
ncbi:MAG: DEAD/DEAH box helicase [Deltaproteobacteria bacterium]|nr:DEAD/DEAH box helicase [Deltaproteobacteria bacterium]